MPAGIDANTPFEARADLTAIAVGYNNPADAHIADMVIPEMGQRVNTKSFQYQEYDIAEGMTVPDTQVGRLGKPQEVQQSGVLKSETCVDHGLSRVVPADDEKTGTNVQARATMHLERLIRLDREIRVSKLVQDTSLYDSDLVTSLSGSAKFSDPSSDPIGFLTERLDGMLIRPNKLVMGQAVWSKIKLHPKILRALYPNGDGNGVATKQQVAEMLEVDDILVGKSWNNTAARGQPLNRARVWGNIIQMQYQDALSSNEEGLTWALRARYGEKVAGTYQAEVGLRGGTKIVVGETVREFILSKHCASLIRNVI